MSREPSRDGGVTPRLPPAGQNWLITTNHYRKRAKPEECWRYAILDKLMTQAAAEGKRIDKAEMWNIITQASQFSTLQTVVFDSSDRSFLVALAGALTPAQKKKPVELRWEDFFPESPQAKN